MSRTVPLYQVRILPALRRIQEKHGYLEHDAMKKFSKESGIPLHSLQEVGSFFPHFKAARPPKVMVRVCRDMSCHMAGSETMIKELSKVAGGELGVEGASCLGRCDRAPAACIVVTQPPEPGAPEPTHEEGHGHGGEAEYFIHGKSREELERLAQQCLQGNPPRPTYDKDLPYPKPDWHLDPYKGQASDYAATRKAIVARDASLQRAVEVLLEQKNWPQEKAELFRTAARRRSQVDFEPDEDIKAAVLAWQTATDWAKGPELGDWANPLLTEMDSAHADHRGLGGAGWPATLKWRDVRDAVRTALVRDTDERAFVVVNGDESEPGTFKDREILLHMPHLVLEGVILGGMVTEATQGFIFIRHEYPEQIAACEEAIRQAEKLGMCGPHATVLGRPFTVSVFTSPGGYILGEQSALIEAMSDHRGEPRNVPPLLNTNGLDDRPTLLSNVETFAWVPYIWLNGGQAYADLGVNGWRGRRLFSISGDVNRPGVYEIPIGLTLRELVHGQDYCQGIVGNKPLKGIAPSGPSGGFLPPILRAGGGLPGGHTGIKVWQDLAARRGFDPQAQQIDIMDMECELAVFRGLSPTGAIGAGVVVYAEGRNMADQAINALEFYRNESCGKCIPCRVGSQKIATLGRNVLEGKVDAGRWSNELAPLISELVDVITQTSICGLGRSIPMPVKCMLDYFADDLKPYLSGASRNFGA